MSRREDIIAKAKALPQMPSIVHRIMAYLGKEHADLTGLAKLIEYDPGLTVNVLRMANSALFGGCGQIATVREALFRLGMNRVYQLVIATGIAPRAKGAVKGYGLEPGELLRHSVAVAVGAERLAQALNVQPPPYTFTAGLLSNIGKTVLGEFLEVDGGQIMEHAAAEKISFEQAERRHLGIDHAELGALLLEHWGLPPAIVRCVRWRLDPCSAPEPEPDEPDGRTADWGVGAGGYLDLDLIHMGHVLATMSGIGGGEDGLFYSVCQESIDRLGVTPEAMATAMEKVQADLAELEPIFLQV